MNYQSQLWSVSLLPRIAKLAAAFVASIGCLVLIGWILDISVLKNVLPLATMKANTALGLILAGTSLFFLTKGQPSKQGWIGQICSLAVATIALATLSEYLGGWDLGIDQLLFANNPQPIGILTPGRMSPLTAVCFAFVGSALWLSAANKRSPSSKGIWVEILTILTSLIALQVVITYVYGVQPIIAFPAYTQMSVHTAVCFVVLAIGIFMANPDQGLMRIMIADSAGGMIARRLLPVAIAIPLLLGWLQIATARMGLFEPGFATSISVVLHIITLTGLLVWNGQQLHRLDLLKQATAGAFSHSNEHLEARIQKRQADLLELTSEAIFVRDEQGAITYWNRGAEAMYGWTRQEAMGHITHTFLQTQPLELASNLDQMLLEQELWQGELTHTCKDGQQIIVESRQVLIRDEQGDPSGFLEVNRDITERKQTEADLQKYKDIFQFAEHGLAIGRGAIMEKVNPAFARIHGYSVEELAGSQILDIFPPETHTQTMEFIQRLNEVGHLSYESVHLRKDGTVFPVLLDITMVDDRPNLPYWIVNLVDITERKQAEQRILNLNQELQRQLAESQTLLEVIPIGIGIALDPECEKIRVNSAFAQMLAIAPTANASLSAPEGHRPTNFQIYQNHRQLAPEDLPLQRAATHGIEVRDFEVDVVWHDGTTLTLLEYAAPLFDERGQTRGSIGAFLNITERKGAEMALQHSLKDLADFKFALDRSSIVAITDTQGTITYVNDKFCELSQYSIEELIGQNHRIINSGYHPKEFFQQMWATITKGQVWQGEIKNRAKDGTFYWVATTIVPFLDATGKPYQYIAVRSDITNRKVAEAELLQLNITLEQRVEERTAQLREANKDLEAFSYTVAHDLRAPLRGIQGFAEALVEDYGDRLDETAQQYIHYIVGGIERMNELISDLLAYSRLSREQIRLTPVRLTQVVAEAQAQLEADLRHRQAQIAIASDLPIVLGHRSVLVQMVVNLLSNAVKFVAPEIQPHIKIWVQTQENWVRVWVEDNGIGINPAHQQQIFGIFERLHGVEAYPGTGIGLAIVRKGAERLGGQAGVESACGDGSRFWIELQASK
ncbi:MULTISPECIES: PAS domain S-box protein [Nostoc]|uniref:histidine kinase n=1 Tax=Nostoc paludosum FACHB-159 TaxID=2692908 RepID=A0ABR8KEQ4_9NOSO|nr:MULTISPECIES: PAS domain S-box protein [Nostoc]MBD2679352.1 PAS domain S-box protein [Nostoc sp. FACHB-857]MBD2737291.1 PAS domain S-box protein [Nostoc paludosum FACHB-159]